MTLQKMVIDKVPNWSIMPKQMSTERDSEELFHEDMNNVGE